MTHAAGDETLDRVIDIDNSLTAGKNFAGILVISGENLLTAGDEI